MKYFGTDGIRGIPNDTLSYDLIEKLGKSIHFLGKKNVIIATDTRISKDEISEILISSIISTGLNVYHLGILPTPALIYYSKIYDTVGIMITASHNPYQDNGIKILKCGIKINKSEEEILEASIDSNTFIKEKEGSFHNYAEEPSKYIDFISKYIQKTNIKIAIDCANGATYKTAPLLFSKVTDKLVVTANTPNGYNINENVGSTHLDNIKSIVLKEKCDIGFAFDGDGDRVLCVDSKGNKIDGDQIIYILSKYLKKHNKLNNNRIVLTIMSNLGIISKLNSLGIDVIESNVGDKYVIEKINSECLSIGGENCGHIILPDYFTSGDGVLVAILLINALLDLSISIEDELSQINLYADIMKNIKVLDRQKVMNNEKLFRLVDKIKVSLNNDCKIIIRPSGTENLIRLSVMAPKMDDVIKYSNILEEVIRAI